MRRPLRLIVCLCGLPLAPQAALADDQDLLRVMAEGYLANRRSFDAFACEFELVRARAATVEDGYEGRYENVVRETGRWLVHGEKVLYELACDPELLKRAWEEQTALVEAREAAGEGPKQGEMGAISLPCGHDVFLTNRFTLSYGPLINAGNLYAPAFPHPGIDVTPFSMSVMGSGEKWSAGSMLRACLEGQFVGVARGAEEFHGRQVLTAMLGLKREQLTLTISLDPARGFLPLLMSQVDPERGKRQYEAQILDVRECSGGRWFPMRWLVVRQPDDEPPYRIQELKVTRLDADRPPRDDQFALELPAGTSVQIEDGTGEFRGHLRLSQAEIIRADDLEALYQRCDKTGRQYREAVEQAKADAPRERSVWRTVLWWTGGIALVLAALLFGRKLRARAAHR